MIAASVIAGVALALLLPGLAGAGGIIISVNDDFFAPDTARSLSNRFEWDPGGDGVTEDTHNVREDHRLFRSGDPTKSRPNFDVYPDAGTYHYYCEVHGSKSGGMDGLIKADLLAGAAVPNQSMIVYWGFSSSNTRTNRFDVQFRVNHGKWRNWKKNTKKPKGNFGANNKPVNLNSAKSYDIRARSQHNLNETRRSRWSPPFNIDVYVFP